MTDPSITPDAAPVETAAVVEATPVEAAVVEATPVEAAVVETAAAEAAPVEAAAVETVAAAPEAPEAIVAIATDGAYSLIVAQFPDLAQAQAAYATLEHIEETTSLRIDGVIIASADAEGKVTVVKATDHSTKTGLKWGVVGGIVAGVIFPPSILVSAVSVGFLGSVIGKIRNLGHKADLTDQLQGELAPNTVGVVALVEDTAVVEIEKALSEADRIVNRAVDKQIAAEIDRQARLAKDSLTTS